MSYSAVCRWVGFVYDALHGIVGGLRTHFGSPPFHVQGFAGRLCELAGHDRELCQNQ